MRLVGAGRDVKVKVAFGAEVFNSDGSRGPGRLHTHPSHTMSQQSVPRNQGVEEP